MSSYALPPTLRRLLDVFDVAFSPGTVAPGLKSASLYRRRAVGTTPASDMPRPSLRFFGLGRFQVNGVRRTRSRFSTSSLPQADVERLQHQAVVVISHHG